MRGRTAAERIGLGAVLLALACAPPSAEPPAPEAGGEPGARRIAVMAPAAAETLEALGVSDRIVAVGDFIELRSAPQPLPRLGAYNLPNAERLVELRVDLLLTTASEAARGEHERLGRIGIRVVPLETSTFAGSLRSIVTVGEATGRAPEARALVDAIEARVTRVRDRVRGAPRPRVLVAVGSDPLYVAGPGSHLDELVRIAGGENIAADALGAYQMMALEAVLERRPEVIIDSADNRARGPFGALAGDWARWPFLPAVAAGRVFAVEPSRLLIPGPRLGEMAERMGRLLHPAIFGPPVDADFAPEAR